MNNPHLDSITMIFRELAQLLGSAGRYVLRTLARMSWPEVLLSCVALALVAAVLPLAITLFVVFMLLKVLVAGALFGARPDSRHDDDKPPRR